MERLGARDLPSVMLAERRLILMEEVALGIPKFQYGQWQSLALRLARHTQSGRQLRCTLL